MDAIKVALEFPLQTMPKDRPMKSTSESVSVVMLWQLSRTSLLFFSSSEETPKTSASEKTRQTTCPRASRGYVWIEESNQEMRSRNLSSSLWSPRSRSRSMRCPSGRQTELKKASDDLPLLMRCSITASLSSQLLMQKVGKNSQWFASSKEVLGLQYAKNKKT